jgi:hypothetical protein
LRLFLANRTISYLQGGTMAARKWTPAQRARQAELIRTWTPWKASTGPRTPAGKAASSKNAVNYSCRELLREMARSNRQILAYINGHAPAPPTRDRKATDSLIDAIDAAMTTATAKRKEKATAGHLEASARPTASATV